MHGGEIAFRPKVTLFEANNAFVSERNVTSIMHCIICLGFDPYLAVALPAHIGFPIFHFPNTGVSTFKNVYPRLFPNERWIANESSPSKYDPSLRGPPTDPSHKNTRVARVLTGRLSRGFRLEPVWNERFRRWRAPLI